MLRAAREVKPAVAATDPEAAATAHAQAELARREGDAQRALGLSQKALTALLGPLRGAEEGRLSIVDLACSALAMPGASLRPAVPYLQQLGQLAEQSGVSHRGHAALADLGRQIAQPAHVVRLAATHALATMAVLGLDRHSTEPWAERVFSDVLLPWMFSAAENRQFEVALALEGIAYLNHVQRKESQAWFKATTGRWVPELAARMRRFAGEVGTPHTAWRAEPVRRIAFYVHNASMLAHVMVLLETLSAAAAIGPRNYAFTVFVLDGRHAGMHEAFERCGVAVRYLQGMPADGWFDRILTLQRTLKEENFAACFWVTLITHMACAFPLRVAPLQGWWSMKYHACDIAEIDVHLAMENVVLRKRMEGIEWRTLGTASRDWFDPALSGEARALRATLPADTVVAASIGRESKLNSPAFLGAVAELLRRHPKLVFLWTGQRQHPQIQAYFESRGLAGRAQFVGWVDTRLYAQAIDLFLDSFPFPCGFTLKQAMAAGKPAVMFESPESIETGVPGAITPIKTGSASADPESTQALRRAFTDREDFDLYFCARTPEEYVELASRLIADASLRAAAGAANKAFIDTFLSSPEAEARKFLDHLDELFASVPTAP